MKNNVFWVCFIVFLVLPIHNPAFSKLSFTDSLTIYGKVTDSRGIPILNATVFIVSVGDTVSALTDSSGFYSITVYPKSLGIEYSTLPNAVKLYQNYPNPFNPSTVIEYEIPHESETALTVYSISGQKVRELVSGVISAGVHRSVWDGRDNRGRGVGAGVYIYRLKAGGISLSGKMLLVDGGGGNNGISAKKLNCSVSKAVQYFSPIGLNAYRKGYKPEPFVIDGSFSENIFEKNFFLYNEFIDYVTDDDMEEIFRIALLNATDCISIPDFVNLIDKEYVVFYKGNIPYTLIPQIENISLCFLEKEEIQNEANENGDYMYLKIDYGYNTDIGIYFQNGKPYVPVVLAWAEQAGSHAGYLSGGGFTGVFTKIFGNWEIEITNNWISKI